MWAKKLVSELVPGTKFRLHPDNPEEHILITIDRNLYGLRPDYTSYNLFNFQVYVEIPSLKLRDVKPGQYFQFVIDINNKHCNTYLMTDQRLTTVTVKHPSPNSIGKLITWASSNDKVVLVTE